MFYCDVTVPEQPLITLFPDYELQAPTEPDVLEKGESLPQVPVCCLTAVDIGGFGRSAQAAWLLDQVLGSFKVANWDARVRQLDALDRDLQAFLAMLIQPGCVGKGAVCETIAIGIRSVASGLFYSDYI